MEAMMASNRDAIQPSAASLPAQAWQLLALLHPRCQPAAIGMRRSTRLCAEGGTTCLLFDSNSSVTPRLQASVPGQLCPESGLQENLP
jgi:hypothetical protein